MKNGTIMQYFEWYLPGDGTLWRQLAEKAASLSEAGITALWLPPAYKDANGMNGVGYAAYDLYDLGEFDQKGSIATKYGTKDDYLAAVRACQQAGIDVYADIVLNHKTGADEVETVNAIECSGFNREQAASPEEQISAWTRFTFPGRNGKYSDFTWSVRHFDGVDWDNTAKKNSIYLFDGKHWENDVDIENGNYDYLMGADLDFDQQEVTSELTRWGCWYYDMTGVNGFRLDAVKHIKSDFYRNWIPAMRAHAAAKDSGKELFVVGEYWHRDVNALTAYLDRTDHALSLFDVPLHFHFFEASCNADSYDLRTIFDNTLTLQDPVHSVTFVDNHDTEPGQALCSFVAPWFKPLAYALILLRESGYPCVFYGDYYGIPSQNVSPVGKSLNNLLSVRRSHAYGTQHDFFDEPRCIGFTREGSNTGSNETDETGLACIISTGCSSCKRMFVGAQHAGQKFFDVTWNIRQIVTIDHDGFGNFPVNEKSVSVYIPI